MSRSKIVQIIIGWIDSLHAHHALYLEIINLIFTGESVDDYGGGYSESITEMCEELQNGSLPVLIPTPNGRDDTGTNRDCFILNPDARSPLHMNMFNFLGKYLKSSIYRSDFKNFQV